MKKLISFIPVILFIVALDAQAPTGYCTVVQQPCNNDGELIITITSGMTPPLTFRYYDVIGNMIIHDSVMAMSDTATNLNPLAYIIVSDNQYNYFQPSCGLIAPFDVDYFNITNPVCPDTIGLAEITINGGASPDSVEWYDSFSGIYIGTGNPMLLYPGYYVPHVYFNGCVMTRTDTMLGISQLTNIDFNINSYVASCLDGSASVNNLTGVVGPYYTVWSNGATTDSISNLISGNYSATITDSIGCSRTRLTYVAQDPVISVNFTTVPATCQQNDGSITAYGSGGVPPYTYVWNTGATSQTLSGLAGGVTYSVVVTDANGCHSNNISVNTALSTPVYVTYSVTNSDCNSPTGAIDLIINGGTPPYDVVWSTYPPMTGASVSSLASGLYPFTVTDSVGCVRTGTAVVSDYGLTGYISFYPALCPNNDGMAGVFAFGTGPFSYLWSTGDTTQGIVNLAPGYYSCTITDALACTETKCGHVILSTPVSAYYSTVPASCLYTADGSITVTPSGGTPPYTFHWSDGQTTATAVSLLTGAYTVHVTDANNCSIVKYINLDYDHSNDSCYCVVTGTAYEDINDNCIFDAGEDTIQNIHIYCPGYGSVYTDMYGTYMYLLPTGSYTLSEIIQYYYPLESCQNPSYMINVNAAPGCTLTYDFAHEINPIHDIQTSIGSMYSPVPGNDYKQSIVIYNNGTVTEDDIQFGYVNDGQLFLTGSTLSFTQLDPVNFPDWYSIITSFPALDPGDGIGMFVDYYVPTNIPLGTVVNFIDTTAHEPPMINWQSEYSPWNNVVNYNAVVVSSFDPNFKEVYPQGEGQMGYISNADSILEYTIHFENTGNYYANKVVITDTLDGNLNHMSVEPGYSSHNYTAAISDNGVLRFTFENINLPWIGSGRFGMVSYSVHLDPLLPPGTEIENSAAIFFDYNQPVITNTTLNTIKFPEHIEDEVLYNNVIVYPNPTDGIFSTNAEGVQYVEIYNAYGQFLLSTDKYIRMNIVDQPAGFYFIRIVTEKGIFISKLIKQ